MKVEEEEDELDSTPAVLDDEEGRGPADNEVGGSPMSLCDEREEVGVMAARPGG